MERIQDIYQFLKCHVLTGSDVTSTVRTKVATLNSEPEHYLESFGYTNKSSWEPFEKVEKYLVRVLQKNSKCTNLNELRYEFLQQNLCFKLKHYNDRRRPQEMFFEQGVQ